jgi:hypothetical protein
MRASANSPLLRGKCEERISEIEYPRIKAGRVVDRRGNLHALLHSLQAAKVSIDHPVNAGAVLFAKLDDAGKLQAALYQRGNRVWRDLPLRCKASKASPYGSLEMQPSRRNRWRA